MFAALGAWIAHAAFWMLLIRGWWVDALGATTTMVFLAIWLLGLVLCSHVPFLPFASYVALVDVALVLLVFKGDVRLT